MKRVLITGANSYVGTNVEKWLMREHDKYYVETLDMQNPKWEEFDFSGFDVVFHVAGIAHLKEKRKNKFLYFKVNRDLAIEVANKAKNANIKHFIFMSSMSIYGVTEGEISMNTIPSPKGLYAISKFQAELILQRLNDKNFSVSILRPPMVFGSNSPGNYAKFRKLSMMIPLFPKLKNRRSVIYIDDLCYFIEKLISENRSGVYHPSSHDFFSTVNAYINIRKCNNKKVKTTVLLNIPVKLTSIISVRIRKLFGNLYYSESIDDFNMLIDSRVETLNINDAILKIEKEVSGK